MGWRHMSPASETWDSSQRKKGEIIEVGKLCNEIEDTREARVITYRTISCADLLFTSLINAVATVVYCICNARILTQRVFAHTADLCEECVHLLERYCISMWEYVQRCVSESKLQGLMYVCECVSVVNASGYLTTHY